MYIFQLMDTYSASGISLLWVCFFQTIAISWFFGANRFRDCVNQMLGFRPNIFWYICWVYLAPFVMIVRFNYFFLLNIIQKYTYSCLIKLWLIYSVPVLNVWSSVYLGLSFKNDSICILYYNTMKNVWW